jgi:TonB-linked SusC/RagA family outer membrane protein
MAVVRRDGSSRFGGNNRYGIFPSASGSWRVINEPFMKGINYLSNLRLRSSWGRVGGQDIGNYASIATIATGQRYVLGTNQELTSGAAPAEMGDKDLKWETTTQTNFGLDIGLFEDKLSLTLDYYIKNTDDVLLKTPIPASSGFNRDAGSFQNVGSIQNTGFELSTDYRNEIGNLTYNLSGNISTNNNEVTSLGGSGPIFRREQSDPNFIRTITEVGEPIGRFYGWVMEGVFRDQEEVDDHAVQEPGTAPGDVKFKDINNDGVIDSNDQTVIGNPHPDFTYGFGLSLRYNSFGLSTQLQGKYGHDIYNLVWAGINDGSGDNNATTEMLNRWTPDNRDTNIPRATHGNPNRNDRPSTRFIEDSSYLRVKSVEVAYRFSQTLLTDMGISSLRVYLQGQNLFTFDSYRSYNPEVGRVSGTTLSQNIDYGAYPIPRSIRLGIQLEL